MKDALRLFAARFTPPGDSPGGAVCISSQTGAANAFIALSLAGCGPSPRAVLAVTPGIPEADRLADDLRQIAAAAVPAARVMDFPSCAEGDRAAPGLRLKAAAALRAWQEAAGPLVVVAPSFALASPAPDASAAPFYVRRGAVSMSDLCARLASLGYGRSPMVDGEGTFAVRGGIVDAWSPGEELPTRFEFFGEDLESLRSFDPATQISISRVDEAAILPAEEKSGASGQTLADLLPTGAAILALDHNAYTLPPGGEGGKARAFTVYEGDPAPALVPHMRFQTAPLPGFAELGAEEAHHPELFAGARARLERHLAAAKARGDHVAAAEGLSGGFELPESREGRGVVVVTKADRVFTKRKAAPAARPAGARLHDFDELEPGEYVVHVDYGVGRFVGSSEIVVDGGRREVFTVEYADGAKLHVPAAHAHLLSRYVGVKGEAVRLHRLDGRRWEKDRRAAQKAVSDLAAALLETQAKRDTVPGFAYDVECDGIAAFEAAFPYEETPDQAAAIAAVKQDLASRKPMDRLVCGDAGYGKTEVAMRAAYIAAMNGRQVAVLAPTTVLAEQHFETFTSRFDGTPVRIESMSRFQSGATRDGTRKRLASGVCDIVIGTHALLADKTVFHDLGLIVIDEEQRFGVRHKEFLKRARATADVLTMSATPIPRTLYLSMTGARDLSLLRTPPRERVEVETRIVADSDQVVRAAIEAEIARGGQVFFLHNRVTTIGRVERRLKEICPGARTIVAHGQMDARSLARRMRAFERGDADILLSTTIVESGIDIPRANTIVVDHAEMFGLADLYQLRGRVGRSSRKGRALFLLPPGGLVDADARERLGALQRHGGLGAGFNLAVRDLELRGAGNLLGAQQSGHIAAVGFTLYCQLLKRTIARMKGEKTQEVVDVRLNLDFIDLSPASEDADAAAALPYDYVEEDSQRMAFMRRFAEAVDAKAVKALAAELADRFGTPPPAVRRLVRVAELRVACARAGIGGIDVRGEVAYLRKVGARQVSRVLDLSGKSADRKLDELISFAKNF